MVALATAKRKLKKTLRAEQKLAEVAPYRLLFTEDPTFDPFTIDYWIRNESDERALCQGYYPDLRVGLNWCSFYPTMMRHTRGKDIGKPFYLLRFQRDDWTMPLMAWKNPRGYNRVRKADIFAAKKNGKTTYCSGLIEGTLLGGPPNIECYSTAYTKEQAKKLFRDTSIVIEKSPELDELFEIKSNKSRIIYPNKSSFFQVLAGEAGAKGAEGVDASLVIMDEIHLMRDRELYDFLELSGLAQDFFLFISISTVGKIDPTAIWSERYNYAKHWIQSKQVDLNYFGIIHEADPIVATCEKARRDPIQIRSANPSLRGKDGKGILELEKILNEVTEAENNPAKLNNIVQKCFNVSVAKSATRSIPTDKWNECGSSFEIPDLTGRRCFLGLDLASSEDLSALVAYFPFDEDEKEEYLTPETLEILAADYDSDETEFEDPDEIDDPHNVEIPGGFMLAWVWCPEAKVEERFRNKQPIYKTWADQGHLIVTKGTRIKFGAILKQIKACLWQYDCVELALDPHNAEHIVQYLEDNTDLAVIEIDQTFRQMTLGTSALITVVVEMAFVHEDNPVLEWCAGNAAAGYKNDAVKFFKDESSDKIDPIVAFAMAIGRACLDDGDAGDDYFDDNGELLEGTHS